ncbi:MAG: SufD family Fe-S cluster assembly protein [Vampirovibrionales bacterium]|nr:SufD family Fe-S cluster assembly protein [Vampirovibrionales bacterium]
MTLTLMPPTSREADALPRLTSPIPPEARLPRQAALLSPPVSRQEAWKYVSTKRLNALWANTAHEAPQATTLSPDMLKHLVEAHIIHPEAYRIVLVDGFLAPQFCFLPALGGIQVASLAWLLQSHDAEASLEPELAQRWQQTLNTRKQGTENVWALNDARWQDGVAIIARQHASNPSCELLPIEVLMVQTQPHATHAKLLLWAQHNTQVQVHVQVVTHAPQGAQTGAHVTLGSELWLDEGAQVTVTNLQSTSHAEQIQLANTRVQLAKDASLVWSQLMHGTGLMRQALSVEHTAEGAKLELNGLLNAQQQGELHFATDMQHAVPHGQSNQVVRLLAHDAGRCEYDGRITIAKGAHHTEASQLCKSMLLSPEAKAYARPWLTILADDVKCAHGATVGQLDDAALFYMQSRGVSIEAARQTLLNGLVADALKRIPDAAARQYFGRVLN